MKLQEVKTLFLGLTNYCNGRCITCWHSNRNPFDVHELDMEIYEHVRHRLFKRIETLHLVGGGESFMYSQIGVLLQDIKRYRFRTTLTSNFASIDEKQREIMKEANIEFIVSLDGSYKQLQEYLRPHCIYERIIDNIKFFVSHGRKVIIQTTVSDHNFYDIDKMISLAEELGVHSLKFQSVQYLPYLEKPYKFSKPPEDLDYLNRLTQKRVNLRYGICLDYYNKSIASVPECFVRLYRRLNKLRGLQYCPNTRDTVKIQENGLVLSCCLPGCKVMGDLHKDSLEDIIGSEAYENNRKTCTCKIIENINNPRGYHG